MGRRTFLGVAGTMAAAAACSPRSAPQTIVPFLVPPEHVVPGKPLFYRTVCRECPAGCGVTARTREGRAVKLEGNPDDPIGRGALCARGQAAIQALYAPGRLTGPMRRGPDGRLSPVEWKAAEAVLADALQVARKKGPAAVRLLTRPEPGAAGSLQKAFLRSLGTTPESRVVLEPLDPAPLRAASTALFGRPELPVYALGEARSVVAFGADFLETWLSPVELSRDFAAGRGRVGPERTRLTWVSPRLSLTGASADSWLRVRPGGELPLALGLLRWLADPSNAVPGLAPEARLLLSRLAAHDPAELTRLSGVSWADVERLGAELASRRPSALLGPGISSQGAEATQLAEVLLLVNLALGNMGRTVLYGLDPLEDPPSPLTSVRALLADMAAGRVEILLVHHADPIGVLPAALRASGALGRVPLVVSFSDRADATSDHAHLVMPDHHPLESFGDVSPRRGVVALCQPVMTPLADTRSASQVLLDLAPMLSFPEQRFPADFFDYVHAHAHVRAARASGDSSDSAVHRAALERGGYYAEARPRRVSVRAAAVAPLLALPVPRAPAAGELDLLVFPTALRYDGRSADLPWLREVPDALTTICWTGWAELSPATAARLGVSQGDLVAISTATGRTELPAYVHPGLRDDVVALPLGGPEALALLPDAIDPRSGALAWRGGRASVERLRVRARLPLLEGSPYQQGREIVRTVSSRQPALARPSATETMYAPPGHPKHRWAMAIDLDRCTGCQACVVACYAENNVPVMGPEAAMNGRHMAWIRIERYLGPRAGELEVDLLPMLCQHCTNAPCEPVCPVYATYHTAEGLNAQVYNRCIGTRYCSHNCPYKVRTFNWRDPEFARPLDLQLNPDVTVRSKGVMEKCTFCVQRIRFAENEARNAGRAVADGEIVPACAQTCPAQAIAFGDANDPGSRVSALARDPRGFAALEELNTQPAITYLARVRDEAP